MALKSGVSWDGAGTNAQTRKPLRGLPHTTDGRYRLLVEAITDYAIYMLDPDGHRGELEPGRAALQGLHGRRDHRPAFLALLHRGGPRSRPAARGRCDTAATRGQVRERRLAGPQGRHAASGRMSSSTRSATPTASWSASPRSPATSPSASAAEEALRRSEEQFRLLVQGVTDYAIYMLDPTGSVTNWNAGARADQGLRRRRDHRPAFLALLHRRGPGRGRAAAGAARPPQREGRFEKEGWRVRKDGTRFWAHVVIDADPRRRRRADRLRQDHPRHHRAARRRSRRSSRRARRCSSRRRWRRSAS